MQSTSPPLLTGVINSAADSRENPEMHSLSGSITIGFLQNSNEKSPESTPMLAVIQYSSSSSLLSDQPEFEYVIGVISPQAISRWCVSPYPPHSPQSGDVWISSGAYAPLPMAVGDGSVDLAVTEAFQYQNGVWLNRGMMLYQHGRWRPACTALYTDGENPHPDTDGFSSWDESGSRVFLGQDELGWYIYTEIWSQTQPCKWVVCTNAPLDTTGYTQLTLEIYVSNMYPACPEGASLQAGLAKSRPDSAARPKFAAVAESTALSLAGQTLRADISGLNGEYYPVFSGCAVEGWPLRFYLT